MIRLQKLSYPLIALTVLCASFTVSTFAAQNRSLQSRDRVPGVVDSGSTVLLRGTVHPKTKMHSDMGPVASDTRLERMTLIFKLSSQQQQDLETLLVQQQQPSSPNYHKWLTPAQYQTRFGVSAPDFSKVKAWLQSQGFEINDASSDRSAIVFGGSAAQVQAAFQTQIHQYQGSAEAHFANAYEVSIPAALGDVVLGIRGLNDFRPRPRPSVKKIKSSFTSSLSGSHFLTPDDFATIYNLKPLYSAGITGAGQKIVIAGQTNINLSDVRTFRSVSGLPASDPTVILVPGSGNPGIVTGDIDEANLDIDWAGAVAPGATIVYVNSKNGAFDSMQYAIHQNLAPVISISYGDCEPNFSSSDITTLDTLFQQANAQGQTIVSAAGDDGAADCDYSNTAQITTATHGLQVDFPPSSPHVTAIGGSTFVDATGNFWSQGNDSSNGSALSYIPETAWNDTATEIASGGSLTAGGGGPSRATANNVLIFTKPSWQVGATPTDGARDVPDVTFAASSDHDGYLVCSQGSCVSGYRDGTANGLLDVFGGTSAGTPTFAGVVALINQKMGSSQGNINPALYALSATSTDAFHDITTGDNKVPCAANAKDCPSGGGSLGYSAGPGYDLATGLGSINVANLVYELSGGTAPAAVADFQLGVFQTNAPDGSITFTRGTTATTDTVTVSALNGFSGTVALSCSVASTLTNTTCQVSPATLSGSGTATLTVSATALAALQPAPNQKLPGSPFWPSGILGLSALVFVGKKKRLPNVTNKAALSMLLVATIAAFGIGCGGGGGTSSVQSTSTVTTPPVVNSGVTGAVTVQATSGSLSHSVQVNVKVN